MLPGTYSFFVYLFLALSFLPVSLIKIVEEDHSAEEDHPAKVTVMLIFDMPCHESTMSPKDVKSLALRHEIPLDLHPCTSSQGWTMDQLPEEVIGSALSSKDLVAQHTTPPLSVDQAIPKKTDFQREVEVEDSKIVAARERKARAT
ncbi:hypothetical protein Tco_0868831, partial [Tanacetum coccineum]